jgi:hypothetical protein
LFQFTGEQVCARRKISPADLDPLFEGRLLEPE